jgi:prepilin-type N-terminal cleavage/methylation domain-containing protein
MTPSHPRPRRGLTLIEVLVAIFIMGIGLISLMVLFPLGALYMANANKDDLAGHAATNATSLAISFNLRNDPTVVPLFTTPGGGLAPIPNTSTGDGYPVYVDGIGEVIGGFGGQVGNQIPRVAPSYVTAPTIAGAYGIPPEAPSHWAAETYFSLLDNLTYGDNGLPALAVGEIERSAQNAFSWAYLLRPRNRDAIKGVFTEVDLSVVVYKQRSTVVLGETAFTTVAVTGPQSVLLSYGAGQPVPNVKKGSWILDATMTGDTDANGNPWPHGFFYRVANVVDTVDGTGNPALSIELEKALRTPYAGASYPGGAPAMVGVVVVLDDVVEVIERWGQ